VRRLPKIPSWKYINLITIDLKKINESKTLIKISNEPMYHSLSFYFGDNLENVEDIIFRLPFKNKDTT